MSAQEIHWKPHEAQSLLEVFREIFLVDKMVVISIPMKAAFVVLNPGAHKETGDPVLKTHQSPYEKVSVTQQVSEASYGGRENITFREEVGAEQAA